MNVQTAPGNELDPSGSDDELLLAEDGIPLDGYDSGSDAVDGSGHEVCGHTKKVVCFSMCFECRGVDAKGGRTSDSNLHITSPMP
jgi:hypothetical protein